MKRFLLLALFLVFAAGCFVYAESVSLPFEKFNVTNGEKQVFVHFLSEEKGVRVALDLKKDWKNALASQGESSIEFRKKFPSSGSALKLYWVFVDGSGKMRARSETVVRNLKGTYFFPLPADAKKGEVLIAYYELVYKDYAFQRVFSESESSMPELFVVGEKAQKAGRIENERNYGYYASKFFGEAFNKLMDGGELGAEQAAVGVAALLNHALVKSLEEGGNEKTVAARKYLFGEDTPPHTLFMMLSTIMDYTGAEVCDDSYASMLNDALNEKAPREKAPRDKALEIARKYLTLFNVFGEQGAALKYRGSGLHLFMINAKTRREWNDPQLGQAIFGLSGGNSVAVSFSNSVKNKFLPVDLVAGKQESVDVEYYYAEGGKTKKAVIPLRIKLVNLFDASAETGYFFALVDLKYAKPKTCPPKVKSCPQPKQSIYRVLPIG